MVKYTKISPFKLLPYTRPKYRLDRTVIYKTGIMDDYETELHFQKDGVLTACEGLIWDGASGGLDHNFMRASLIHDCLCHAIGKKKLSVKYQPVADKIMNKITKEDGMFFLRRWWTYGAVRSYQHFSRKHQLKKGEVIL